MTFPWPVHPAAEAFPLLSGEELAELAADIGKNGLLEPVWLYRDPDIGTSLLDGRNRYRACDGAGVELRMRYYDGTDPIGFSISLNMKRRHLTAGQRAFAGLTAERLYAAEAAKLKAQRERDEKGRLTASPIVADLREQARERQSVERAAKVSGSSGRAISQAKRIERDAPDLAEQVRVNKLALDRAERIIRDREADKRRIAKARAEAAAQPAPTLVDIRDGDFRNKLAEIHDIDAIITDPPYGYKELQGRDGTPFGLLRDLAAWADKVLKPDGVLALLMGQTWLPEVYRSLDGHRPYRWTACYLTPGNGYASMARGVQSNWKPLIIYGRGPSNHKWGQDYGAFHVIVERLTERGQTIADPFMGSGTTLLAGYALGRHVIGADIDPESVETARRRLA